MSVKTIHIVAEGLVQGVCYRATTEQKGNELALTGTVKNLRNGSVEIYATGSVEALTEFAEWCWKGSTSSKVTNIEVKHLPEVQEFTSFSVIY